MNFGIRFRPTLMIIMLLSLVGMVAIYYGTSWGPWAYSDSAGYIATARNLLAGHGLGYPAPSGSLVPLMIHPPFYPIVLSILGLVGFDIIEAARWLNIFLFGATIFLSGAFTYYLFRSSWFSISLSTLLLTMPTLVDVSAGAMTEPLFLFTSTLGICTLIIYLKYRRKYLLIISSISCGLALLTRYQGAVLVVTGIFILLIAGGIPWKKRAADGIEFSLISTIPMGILLIWFFSLVRVQGAGDFRFPLDILSRTIELRRNFMEIFWSWLPFQDQLPSYTYKLSRNVFILFTGLIVLLVLLIFIKIQRSHKSAQNSSFEFTFSSIWIVFSIGNFIFISIAFLFSNLLATLYPRAFLPVQFALVFALTSLVLSLIGKYRLPSAFGWASAVFVLIFSFSYARTSWNIISRYHLEGAGYTSKAWHESKTLKSLRDLPTRIPIISNESAAVLLLLNHAAYDFCTLPCSQLERQTYGNDLQDPAQRIFRENGAALVLFYNFCAAQSDPWYSYVMDQLKSLTRDLKVYFSSCDGAIYFYPTLQQN
jgi:4-amino-4-deoxy-L-arabinose transferase-like glycosyltransferase